jgi:hypothetical protein
MPRKTTAKKLAEQEAKAQADEITRIIGTTCDLLDTLLADTNGSHMPAQGTAPIVERMKAYLDRRGPVAEDPAWIAKMRRTVRDYGVQRGRLRGEDAFNLD